MINAKQLASILGALSERERQLCRQLRCTIFDTFGSDLPSFESNHTHRHDAAKSLFDNDESGLNRRIVNELMAIESAREAINHGNYGVCEMCHGEIEFTRLQALPATTLCRECQKHINRPTVPLLVARS
jgi:RNA polymerase-binding transcription factor DksA